MAYEIKLTNILHLRNSDSLSYLKWGSIKPYVQ